MFEQEQRSGVCHHCGAYLGFLGWCECQLAATAPLEAPRKPPWWEVACACSLGAAPVGDHEPECRKSLLEISARECWRFGTIESAPVNAIRRQLPFRVDIGPPSVRLYEATSCPECFRPRDRHGEWCKLGKVGDEMRAAVDAAAADECSVCLEGSGKHMDLCPRAWRGKSSAEKMAEEYDRKMARGMADGEAAAPSHWPDGTPLFSGGTAARPAHVAAEVGRDLAGALFYARRALESAAPLREMANSFPKSELWKLRDGSAEKDGTLAIHNAVDSLHPMSSVAKKLEAALGALRHKNMPIEWRTPSREHRSHPVFGVGAGAEKRDSFREELLAQVALLKGALASATKEDAAAYPLVSSEENTRRNDHRQDLVVRIAKANQRLADMDRAPENEPTKCDECGGRAGNHEPACDRC